MGRVEIVAASDDKDRAEALAAFLRTRGHLLWGEIGKPGLVPIAPDLVVVVLWSIKTTFSMQRMSIERRALDAWSEERLVFARLDPHPAPVGLRDLPAIEAWKTLDPIAFEQIAKAIRAADVPKEPPAPTAGGGSRGGLPADEETTLGGDRPAGSIGAPPAMPSPAATGAARPSAAPARAKGAGGRLALLLVLVVGLVLGLVLVAAVFAALFLYTGSPPGNVPLDPIDPVPVALAVGAVVALVGLLLASRARSRSRSRLEDRQPAHRGMPADLERAPAQAVPAKKKDEAPTDDVLSLPASFLFVSYAHEDRPRVDSVIDATKAVGREVWTDAKIPAGPGWAGEIVKALKASEGVIVCCSTGAFESDHVKREVYLADRFRKRLLPVFLENIEPPDDFLYFFADRQWLFAHAVQPDELKAKIAAALD